MPTYQIKVRVDYTYEVEANSQAEAEEQGWHYDDYSFGAQVYSIKSQEISE